MDAAFWSFQDSASPQNLDEYFQQFLDTNGTGYQNDPMLLAFGKQPNTRMGGTDTSMDIENANPIILT
ncbi:hypothetical protein CT0861_06244 [Colletotrichum tofieldiae]|uniref:Uncharacterized protein n=1 Tax=Colletotrichum tofieldiae TaxID=708197 RepID=A0A166N7B2_9PEZI|nr:hypothetical protein CT0861_06244 [Colletotrichum tofieldiae]